MSIGVSEEHEELRRTIRRWLDTTWPPEAARTALEAPPEELPIQYKDLAAQGWLGLHVDERFGGQGFGLTELAVVLEELGWSCVPGPILSTLVVSSLISLYGTDEQREELLPGLVDGSRTGGLACGSGCLSGRSNGSSVLVSGKLRPVLGAPAAGARLLLVPVQKASDQEDALAADPEWCLLEIGDNTPHVTVRALPALDPSRPIGEVELSGVAIPDSRRLRGVPTQIVRELVEVLAAAESAGGARWCLETTTEYAKIRQQFGRPIGQFQAVKHRLSNMLVLVEQAAATAWDAALSWDATSRESGASTAVSNESVDRSDETAKREAVSQCSLATAVASAVCLDAFADCAKDCVQLHGGIGFTWEHDAHRYLKRAMATWSLLEGLEALIMLDRSDEWSTATETRDDTLTRQLGPPSKHAQITGLALSGVRRALDTDLPPEADALRDELRSLIEQAAALHERDRREFMVDHGLIAPHWPRPWGRDASALEQLVLADEMARASVIAPNLGVGAWALPTLITHGTSEQQDRWIRPTLLGDLIWCQLFSEPGAGSDLASLSTRAERIDGGWRLNGQKVWTSLAKSAHWGICMARSDPAAPKHEGIIYLIVDMHAPGIDVRPLRELTGEAMFNEVFLDGVFVPDENVVGSPGDGWRIGRTTLANERISMSSGSTFGMGVESLLRSLERLGDRTPSGTVEEVGTLLAEAHALRLIGHRSILRSLAGADPGPGASVRKLLGAEHEQRVQEMGLRLCGPEGSTLDGRAARWGLGFLSTRCLTIAGGTSEVQRNVIAERLLGLPRDPEPASSAR